MNNTLTQYKSNKINNENDNQKNIIKMYRKKNINIIYSKLNVSYDGVDEFGPESLLYEFKIFYRNGYNYYLDIWYREDWFDEEYEMYSLLKKY